MAARNSDKIKQSLKKKGFIQSDNDHHYFTPTDENDLPIPNVKTKISLGRKHDIGDNLLNAMARQTHLSKRDFLNLIDCPLGKEEYLKILKEKGIID